MSSGPWFGSPCEAILCGMFSSVLFAAVLVSPVQAAPAQAPAAEQAVERAAAPPRVAATPYSPAERPRLCLLVAVDQMIPEQLERLEPWFTGGLGRLAREGVVFREAYLPFAVTETGPGHVTLSSGRTPAQHGVIANQWIDAESDRAVYCVEDPEARYVGAQGPAARRGARSWRNARVPALGDHLQRAFPGARVVSIAGKDRAAVGLGGAGADAVLWWDRGRGGFQSSDAYLERLPEWVTGWNEGWIERLPERWDTLIQPPYPGSGTDLRLRDGSPSPTGRGSLPQALEVPDAALRADPEHGPRAVALLARTVYATPFLDEFVLELALRAVCEWDLGGSPERVDLLALGLSSCDVVGHAYGPYSAEVTDVLLRIDRDLGRLFELLDDRLGREGWILALSADHGVLELPEELARRGVGARRVHGRAIALTLQHVASALQDELGVEGASLRNEAGGIYLRRAELRAAEVDLGAARRVARDALLAGGDWIARAWTREELLDVETPDADPWLALARASYDPERGPDVVYQVHPWHLKGLSSGTSHGSPYPYDRRVPLVFHGPGLAPGRDHEPATTLDVVPTLLAWLGLEPPPELEGVVR